MGNESSQVQLDSDNIYRIEGGATRDLNLFHSFQEFRVGIGEQVYFSPDASIQTIFARVTGDRRAEIRGLLGVEGNADLFLISPRGIFFGGNSSLDIEGAFTATTADAVEFHDLGLFSSLNPLPPSNLLTVDPSAFLFSHAQVLPIVINNGTFLLSAREHSELGSFQLLGGDIQIINTTLQTWGRDVHLAGVAEASQVAFIPQALHTPFQLPTDVQRAHISILDTALLTVGFQQSGDISMTGDSIVINSSGLIAPSSTRSGNVYLSAARSVLADRSFINARGAGSSTAGEIIVSAGGHISLNGTGVLSSNVAGPAGKIQLFSGGSILLAQSSNLTAQSLGSGAAGSITIQAADAVHLLSSAIEVSGVGLPEAEGQAGAVDLIADNLTLDQQSQITATTEDALGGSINLSVRDTVLLRNGSLISTQGRSGRGVGNAGNITISSQFVLAVPAENSDIFSTAEGGDGGEIQINLNGGGIFGFVIGEDPSLLSDISTRSRRGVDGEIRIAGFETGDRGLIELPQDRVDVSRLIAEGCGDAGAIARQSELVNTGRGGVPPQPDEVRSLNAVIVDWAEPQSSSTVREPHPPVVLRSPTSAAIAEAQGWRITQTGAVELIAMESRAASQGLRVACGDRPSS
ncbi:MAG: filamentous hemagglutinin N-terminal domain-containing protein [Kaiparowitsia implicata GSE-PSE-MK54-09C]|jgi:filamentous hemagglutinin family protein|nr:filamentous hemagglutinin N-terminal domain-containing protein [Kaiparowitsia implicata GSE-PSE-MK54-09C]